MLAGAVHERLIVVVPLAVAVRSVGAPGTVAFTVTVAVLVPVEIAVAVAAAAPGDGEGEDKVGARRHLRDRHRRLGRSSHCQTLPSPRSPAWSAPQHRSRSCPTAPPLPLPSSITVPPAAGTVRHRAGHRRRA